MIELNGLVEDVIRSRETHPGRGLAVRLNANHAQARQLRVGASSGAPWDVVGFDGGQERARFLVDPLASVAAEGAV